MDQDTHFVWGFALTKTPGIGSWFSHGNGVRPTIQLCSHKGESQGGDGWTLTVNFAFRATFCGGVRPTIAEAIVATQTILLEWDAFDRVVPRSESEAA